MVIKGWTSSYELQKQNPKRIDIGFVVYYSVHEVFGSKVPAFLFQGFKKNALLLINKHY